MGTNRMPVSLNSDASRVTTTQRLSNKMIVDWWPTAITAFDTLTVCWRHHDYWITVKWRYGNYCLPAGRIGRVVWCVISDDFGL